MRFINYYSPADDGGLVWTPTEATVVELVPVPPPAKVGGSWPKGVSQLGDGGLLLKAGTPLYQSSSKWVPSNSSSSGKRIIVAKDYEYLPNQPGQGCLVPCITKGFVDQARAEAAYGYSYADADKSGFDTSGIVLAGADFGSGGGLPEYSAYFSIPFLSISNGNPYWNGLDGTVPSIVSDYMSSTVILQLSQDETTSEWGCPYSPSDNTICLEAVFDANPDNPLRFYLDSKEIDEGYVSWVFRRLDGGDSTFTFSESTSEWAYDAGT